MNSLMNDWEMSRLRAERVDHALGQAERDRLAQQCQSGEIIRPFSMSADCYQSFRRGNLLRLVVPVLLSLVGALAWLLVPFQLFNA